MLIDSIHSTASRKLANNDTIRNYRSSLCTVLSMKQWGITGHHPALCCPVQTCTGSQNTHHCQQLHAGNHLCLLLVWFAARTHTHIQQLHYSQPTGCYNNRTAYRVQSQSTLTETQFWAKFENVSKVLLRTVSGTAYVTVHRDTNSLHIKQRGWHHCRPGPDCKQDRKYFVNCVSEDRQTRENERNLCTALCQSQLCVCL